MKNRLAADTATLFKNPYSSATLILITSLIASLLSVSAHAQQTSSPQPLPEIVVSASRAEQDRFDAPAAIDVVQINSFSAQSPLVNMSELLGSVPGVQVRERQNYAQDLQISVRGFGTRSTFGVRGVRILIDGIPATMPDGQEQLNELIIADATLGFLQPKSLVGLEELAANLRLKHHKFARQMA